MIKFKVKKVDQGFKITRMWGIGNLAYPDLYCNERELVIDGKNVYGSVTHFTVKEGVTFNAPEFTLLLAILTDTMASHNLKASIVIEVWSPKEFDIKRKEFKVEIIATRIVNDALAKVYQINDIKGIGLKNDLPQRYLKGSTRCFKTVNGDITGSTYVDILDGEFCRRIYLKGTIVTPEELALIVIALKHCKDAYKEVKRVLNKAREKWQGKLTLIIDWRVQYSISGSIGGI